MIHLLQFILGLFIGIIVGFIICAIFSMSGAQDRAELPASKETGEKNVPSK